MKVTIENVLYEVIQKRKLKKGEKIIGVASTITGKKYNLVKHGKIKLMIPQ